MEDDALIAAMATGDDRALRELFDRHAPRVAARLRRMMPVDAVEDVLQERFIAVWSASIPRTSLCFQNFPSKARSSRRIRSPARYNRLIAEEERVKPLAAAPSSMRGSGIREIMNLALGMEGVLHVEVGEPDFPTPPHIVEAAHQAALAGFTRYTNNAGIPSFRAALSDKLRRFNGLEVSPDRITVTCGAVEALMASVAALVEPGDEVLLPDPGWPNYEMMVKTMHGVPVRYRLDPDRGFQPDLGELESLVTPRTKAILTNSPSNPTGAVMPPELVEGIVRLAERHDLWLISDEVYEQIVFDGEHVSPALFDGDGRVISIFSFSKTYSMTGWRVGYAVTPESMTRVMNKLQEPFISCASAVSQKAAEAALLGPQDCVEEMRAAYQRRRGLLMSLLEPHGMVSYCPQGAFYAMVDISRSGMGSTKFARHMLLERKVAVAPGDTFGPSGEGFIRVALCAHEDTIERAVEAIAEELETPKVTS